MPSSVWFKVQGYVTRGKGEYLKCILFQKDLQFERVVIDMEMGRRKSIKRLFQEYGRENVKDVYIAD